MSSSSTTNKPRQRRKPRAAKTATATAATAAAAAAAANRMDAANTQQEEEEVREPKSLRWSRGSNSSNNNNNNNKKRTSVIVLLLILIAAAGAVFWIVFAPAGNDDSNNDGISTGAGSGSGSGSNTTVETEGSQSNKVNNAAAANDDNNSSNNTEPPVPRFTSYGSYELLETVPHDSSAFTQGLVTVHDASSSNSNGRNGTLKFLEGTGMHGASQLRLVDMSTGKVLQRHALPAAYFGEGIAHYRDYDNANNSSSISSSTLRLIQLTWREKTAFEYILQQQAPNTANDTTNHTNTTTTAALLLLPLLVEAPVANWTYRTTTMQGWGVTYAKATHQFFVSDGSSYLHVWDATTASAAGKEGRNTPQEEVRKVPVTVQTADDAVPVPVAQLNELEWDPATNTVLANVWFQDVIVRIDPATGLVRTIYDLQSLFPVRPAGADVLNGIALTYDSSLPQQQQPADDANNDDGTDQVWVTGKYWPNMYRIRLID